MWPKECPNQFNYNLSLGISFLQCYSIHCGLFYVLFQYVFINDLCSLYKEEHFKEGAGFKMFSQYLCASTLANGVEVCRLIFMEFKCIQQKFI